MRHGDGAGAAQTLVPNDITRAVRQHFLKVFWFYLGGVGEGAGISTVLLLRGDNLATIVFAFNYFLLVGAGLRLCANH